MIIFRIIAGISLFGICLGRLHSDRVKFREELRDSEVIGQESVEYLAAVIQSFIKTSPNSIRQSPFATSIFNLFARKQRGAVPIEMSRQFWERFGGDKIFDKVRSNPGICSEALIEINACSGLFMVAGNIPVPEKRHEIVKFFESVGLTRFIKDNIEDITEMLIRSSPDGYISSAGEANVRSYVSGRGFAWDWINRFPQVIGESYKLKRTILCQRRIMHAPFLLAPERPVVTFGIVEPHRKNFLSSSFQAISDLTLYPALWRVKWNDGDESSYQSVLEWYERMSYEVFEWRAEPLKFLQVFKNEPQTLKLIGRFLAMSLLQRVSLGVDLPVIFYARLLGSPVLLSDIEQSHPELFELFQEVLQAKTRLELNEIISGPLPMSERQEAVSLTNRRVQVQTALNNLGTDGLNKEFTHVADGFFNAIPRDLFDGISPADLRCMILGDASEYTLQEIRQYVRVRQGRFDMVGSWKGFWASPRWDRVLRSVDFAQDAIQVQWLYQVLEEFDPSMRKRFFYRFTGNNFEVTRINVKRSPESPESSLPDAFASGRWMFLALPEYASKEQLKQKLMLAIDQQDVKITDVYISRL